MTVNVDPDELRRCVKGLRPELATLFWECIADGWLPMRAYEPGVNGEIAVGLDRGPVRLWLLHDRGTPSVEVGGVSWSHAYWPTAWREFLTGRAGPTRAKLRDEVEMLRDDLRAIERGIASGQIAESAVRAVARRQLRDDPPWTRDIR
jgi:hypothetical protein